MFSGSLLPCASRPSSTRWWRDKAFKVRKTRTKWSTWAAMVTTWNSGANNSQKRVISCSEFMIASARIKADLIEFGTKASRETSKKAHLTGSLLPNLCVTISILGITYQTSVKVFCGKFYRLLLRSQSRLLSKTCESRAYFLRRWSICPFISQDWVTSVWIENLVTVGAKTSLRVLQMFWLLSQSSNWLINWWTCSVASSATKRTARWSMEIFASSTLKSITGKALTAILW